MENKTLVIRAGALGDFILTLPILEAVHCRNPGGEVELLGYPHIAELAVARHYAATSKRIDSPEWAPLFSAGGALAESEEDCLRRFERTLCIWPDADGTIRDNLSRAGARNLMYVNPMPPSDSTVHVIEFMAAQCARAGVQVRFPEPQLFPSPRDQWWAERYMRVTCAGERPLLGLHPGSGSPKKNWPAKDYLHLAKHWIRHHAGNVLLTIGPADEAAAEVFGQLRGNDGLYMFREEYLPRVAACVQRCEAFVGNDSGITHMAAALQVPSLALFGPTDPRVWRPLSRKAEVLQATHGTDITTLTLEQVVRGLEELLQRV